MALPQGGAAQFSRPRDPDVGRDHDTARAGAAVVTRVPPPRVEVGYGHHLRLVRPDDLHLDLRAVTASPERLAHLRGSSPSGRDESPAALAEADLASRVEATRCGRAYHYLLLDIDETAVLGHVDLEPAADGSHWAIGWWVVEECVATDVESALRAVVDRWASWS